MAANAGVNIQTIRFYERRRLLREPARTASGYRDYDRTDLESVVFIKWCQRLGFTLKEEEQLLALHTAIAGLSAARAGHKCNELGSILRMAKEKLTAVQEKIGSLKVMGKQLSSAFRKLQSQPGPVCPAWKPQTGRRQCKASPAAKARRTT
jgi:DNA-binding transcriptional MerR regulator